MKDLRMKDRISHWIGKILHQNHSGNYKSNQRRAKCYFPVYSRPVLQGKEQQGGQQWDGDE